MITNRAATKSFRPLPAWGKRAPATLMMCMAAVGLMVSQAGAKSKRRPVSPPPIPSPTSPTPTPTPTPTPEPTPTPTTTTSTTFAPATLKVGGYALAGPGCQSWGSPATTSNGEVYSVLAFGWTESAVKIVSLSKGDAVFYTFADCVQGVAPA